jgi:[pyruvate, water dikinase]-phosphate phosphotransferase / [pyruvate, water dikinase] kinase
VVKKQTNESQAPRESQPARAVVYAISDSTGNLARHMLAAFVTQFPPDALVVRVEQFVRTADRLQEVLDKAREERAVVCHAVVAGDRKKTIVEYCQEHSLPCLDLTGPTVEFLARHTGLQPHADVDALHRLDHTYDRRIDALEFALNHDDALGLETLHQADIVLVGVSRTSKTPTSIYLAQQGYLVGNVSLAIGIDPPAQLLALPKHKVVALMIGAQQLAMIRARRQAAWHASRSSYDDPDHIERELTWARRLYAQRGWPIIDVTDQAIEETAARAMALVGVRASA